MKNKIFNLLIIFMALLSLSNKTQASSEFFSISVNGKDAIVNTTSEDRETPIFIQDERTFVPIRAIGTMLGYDVKWDEERWMVRLESKELHTIITMHPKREFAEVNGVSTLIDGSRDGVFPIIKNDRVYVPLRFVSENMGFNVDYVRENKNGNINHKISLIRKDLVGELFEYRMTVITDIRDSEEFEERLEKEFEERVKQDPNNKEAELISCSWEGSSFGYDNTTDDYEFVYTSKYPLFDYPYSISKNPEEGKYKFPKGVKGDYSLFTIHIKSNISDELLNGRIKTINPILDYIFEGLQIEKIERDGGDLVVYFRAVDEFDDDDIDNFLNIDGLVNFVSNGEYDIKIENATPKEAKYNSWSEGPDGLTVILNRKKYTISPFKEQ